MARPPGNRPTTQKPRTTRPPAVAGATSGAAAATVDAPKKKVSVGQFFREVRGEARKITWTSRKETWITSVMVLIFVVITAIFFVVVNWGLSNAVNLILTFARGA